MEKEELKNVEVSVELCPECESEMAVNQTCDYLVVFHPEIITLIQKISEKVKNFPHKIHYKFPSMDCHNLCAAKGMANRLIENLVREDDPNSFILIQQLSEKLISVSDCNLIPGNHKICMLCGLKFKSTRIIVTHLTLRHPEYLALIQFLRCHPLSKLKFQKDIVILSRTKTQELIRQITDPTVLATGHSFLKLDKFSSHLHQECLTKGYVNVKDDTGTPSLFDTQLNCYPNAISAEEKKNIKQIVENSPYSDKNNIAVVLVPKKILKTPLENSNSERHILSCNKSDNNTTVPTTSKIIRYGVEDVKKDQLSRQQEKEKITQKEKILRKVLAKNQEKEIKKKVLYWQKKLTRYVIHHKKLLFKLEYNLTNAKQLGTSQLYRQKLLEKVSFYVKSDKVKRTVMYLLKKLFEVMEKVPAVNKTEKKLSNRDSSSAEKSPEKIVQSPQGNIQNCSLPKDRKSGISSFVCKENPAAFISPSIFKVALLTADPYIDTTLITNDKQFFECSCGKLNCLGLHPENFY